MLSVIMISLKIICLPICTSQVPEGITKSGETSQLQKPIQNGIFLAISVTLTVDRYQYRGIEATVTGDIGGYRSLHSHQI